MLTAQLGSTLSLVIPAFMAIEVFSKENMAAFLVTAIAAVLNLVISYLIIKHFIYKPLQKIAAERKKDIADKLEAAKVEQAEAEKLNAQVKADMQAAKENAAKIILDAKQDAENRKEMIIATAKKEADRYLADKEAEQQRVWEKKEREQRDQAIRLSMRVLQQLGRVKNEQDEQALVSDVVSSLNTPSGEGKQSGEN
ncbi:ATP synthase F0 subunit B [Amygdalobacter nucleatus]|uniref:ATP synthase F0 subunit B n=1 Tax=Amygdalobacter nucleatus TaxID=3029274 RepID=UPI0027A6FB0E|nr:ATP synthase F0 subunit B [Amygdalobacter nucleatus]WEG36368.1 ATP synthase F0 subunit B [Amygdalobacter nucleatus]